MATLQEEHAQRQNLRTILAQIDLLKPDNFRRSDLTRELNFDDGLPFFERTWRLFRDLATLDLERASYSLLIRLNQVAQQTRDQLQQVRVFNPQQFGAPQNAKAQRDALIAAVRDSYDGAFENVMMARAYIGHPGSEVAQVEEDARRIVARTEALFAEQQAALAEKAAAADKVLEALRQSAARVGIAQFAGRFEAEANAYKTAARYWLIATVTVG